MEAGLVASLGRPGGNITRISFIAVELTPKRFELLLELVPHAQVIGFLVNQTVRPPSAPFGTCRRPRVRRECNSQS